MNTCKDRQSSPTATPRPPVTSLLMNQAALLTALVLGCSVNAAEWRAFWVDTWGTSILNQSQVDDLLGIPGTPGPGQIRNANCNAVFIEVRRNCDACYPSSMGEPYMSGLTPTNFNALQACINAAHDTTGGKKRIEVHCWMVTFRTSGGAVYKRHSDPPTGSLTNLDNYWPSRDDTGAEVSDKAFDPGHPLALQYTVGVAMDLVNNFDIDGIHYDYIRFTANDQGYNPTSIARYNARYGLTGQPAYSNEQFKQWRRDQVTAVVRQVYARIQKSKPWVKQSGSFVTWNPSPTNSTRAAFQGTRPYYDVYSDWDSWVQEGIVDMAVPMTYYNWASLPNDYLRWMNFEKDRKGNRHMIVGPGIYLNSLTNAISEILMTRDPSPATNYAHGFCGYSQRSPFNGGTWTEFSPELIMQVTPAWDGIPDMPWKTAPTNAHLMGTVTLGDTGTWADGATVSVSGPTNRTMDADGTGFYAFIDLPPGTYTVTASNTEYSAVSATVTIAVGQVTGNMYEQNLVLAVPAVAAFGDNTMGQCQQAQSVTDAIAVAAGGWHTLVLRSDGRVLAWGSDSGGQCQVPASLHDALTIAAGGYHSLVLRANGAVVAWGANDYGQTNVPANLGNVVGVAAGALHSVALRANGTVVVWGDNSVDQTNQPAGLTNVIAVAAGGYHTLALKADGTVVAWGWNRNADGNDVGQSRPPWDLTNVVAIAAGDYHSLAVRADRTVVPWGDHSQGQCDVPSGLTNVVAIAGGGAHSVALQADGSVVAWGADWNNQCDVPANLRPAVGVAAGSAHTVVLIEKTTPVPVLLYPARKGGQFHTLVQTLNRRTYALEANGSPASNNWIGVCTNAGNGALRILTDPTATAKQRFYRMRQW
jgi:uncharacterized lipoprotein YddW (UPF0748 family)